MKLITKDGIAIIDINSILMAEYNKREYNNVISHELNIIFDKNHMNYMLKMKSEIDAKEFIDTVENKEGDSSVNMESPKTYIDGFKDGCEYTLKLNKET